MKDGHALCTKCGRKPEKKEIASEEKKENPLKVTLNKKLDNLSTELEKWATNKLVKKNKEIRLANAKKTIETLKEEEASGEEK